jgi:hypothetical protein
LLRRESFDEILVNTVISRWGCYNLEAIFFGLTWKPNYLSIENL